MRQVCRVEAGKLDQQIEYNTQARGKTKKFSRPYRNSYAEPALAPGRAT
ncbi:MAG TPA: hypothetical protein VJT09_05240 [Pyrinomonadaceae bacterium]|nr:hypothetical protein [Pyrinomonadaceae bacterium]